MLVSYTTTELIHDFICDQCSFNATKSLLLLNPNKKLYKLQIEFLNSIEASGNFGADYVHLH